MEPFWGSADLRRMCQESDPGHPITIETRRGPHSDLPKAIHKYDKIIISGSMSSCLEESEWSLDLERMLKQALTENKPVLGVCYGHQLIARTLGGVSIVRKSETPEFGWIKIQSKNDNPLFDGLLKEFYSFASHWEEVSQLPKDVVCFASSERCSIQGLQLKDRPVFGIQFHPERSLESGESSLNEKKKTYAKDILLNVDKGKKFFDSKVGEKIFGNFLKL
jgi:GMP synthase (glutamine-hydrolysing)